MEVKWIKGYNRKSANHVEEVSKVRGAYSDFWKNIKFRKGWDAPLFTEEEVDVLLEDAAEISALIRSYLDELDPGFKMRVQGGSSFEYLWEVDFHPPDEPAKFVRQLVHATFRDAKGYVEGLKKEIVDTFVSEYLESHKGNEEPAWNPSQLQEAFNHLQAQIQSMSGGAGGIGGGVGGGVGGGDGGGAGGHEAQLRHLRKATQHLVLANRHLLSSMVTEVEEGEEKKKQEENVKLSVSQTDFDLDEEIDEELEKQEEREEEGEEETKEEEKDQEMAVEEEETGDEKMEEEGEEKEGEKEKEGEEEKEEEKVESLTCSVTGVKVNKVQEDVDFLQPKIKDLASEFATLDKQIEESEHPATHKAQTKALTKKCLGFSERLMQSLLKLDEIQGGSQESRVKRKEQAKKINTLMDTMDDLKEKIRGLQDLVEDDEEIQEREQREREEKERIEQDKKLQQKKEQERRAKVEREREEKELRESWAELKLDPKLRVQGSADKFIITGNIPGMEEKDIGIEVIDQGNTLQISGVRLPSPAELQQMKNRLKQFTYPKEHEKELLLRLGTGRFGRFCEKYSLKNCDKEKIEASYERGVLRIFIPKIMSQRRHQQHRAQQQHAAFPGFYSDRDAWW